MGFCWGYYHNYNILISYLIIAPSRGHLSFVPQSLSTYYINFPFFSLQLLRGRMKFSSCWVRAMESATNICIRICYLHHNSLGAILFRTYVNARYFAHQTALSFYNYSIVRTSSSPSKDLKLIPFPIKLLDTIPHLEYYN